MEKRCNKRFTARTEGKKREGIGDIAFQDILESAKRGVVRSHFHEEAKTIRTQRECEHFKGKQRTRGCEEREPNCSGGEWVKRGRYNPKGETPHYLRARCHKISLRNTPEKQGGKYRDKVARETTLLM